MLNFECTNCRGSHEVSAEKADGGGKVTVDGVTKFVEASQMNALALGAAKYFGGNEHCLDSERDAINEILNAVLG
ncbi:hypothetical protein JKY72_04660 [Candidatus Gracilibacteria bacterium]|nr:hypothetical protein [Candidatus Gracilibacteria bacterium]